MVVTSLKSAVMDLAAFRISDPSHGRQMCSVMGPVNAMTDTGDVMIVGSGMPSSLATRRQFLVYPKNMWVMWMRI